jgi:hypothetical protein
MNKRWILIIVIVLIIFGLGLGAWSFYRQADEPAPAAEPEVYQGFDYPTSAQLIDWEDREIFKSGLVGSAAAALQDLPLASTYYISLEIAPDLSSAVKGHQIVRYFNAEDQALSEIYFRLYPNYQGGLIKVSHLTLDGGAMIPSLESEDTALRVDLKNPLQPGESLVFEMDFELSIPTEMGGNYGLYGYFEDVLVLDTFYPMIPAHDENGWYSQTPQNNGDLTYTDAAFYLVQVEAPADLVLVSTGVAVDQQVQGNTQTTVFAGGPARDFYLAGSRKFVELSKMVGDTQVRIYTLPEYSVNQTLALDYGVHAIEILSDLIGLYPYTEFEVLSSPMQALGIEYPGVTSIVVDEFVDGEELYGMPTAQMLESTLVHEAGHMWFYNAVGNDQQNQPWVDEALAQYTTYLYYQERYGSGTGYVDSWKYRWGGVKNADIPIGLPAGEYHGAEYSAIVYGRGPLFYLEIENQYGLETVLTGIQNYYQDHLWQNGYTENLRAALEAACDCDLGSEFKAWIYQQ